MDIVIFVGFLANGAGRVLGIGPGKNLNHYFLLPLGCIFRNSPL
jgi:hypothetical protein